jgi:pilus assembly protein CpaC
MRKFVLILLIAIAAPRLVHADDAAAVKLLVGRSTIVDVGSAIARVSLTSADIADAVVTSSNQLLVNGKMPGTISMYVWERSGGLRRYEIVVQRDLALLNDQFKRLFPGEAIEAQSSGKGIVLSGLVSNKEVFDKAYTVAGGYVEKADEVVNMVKIQESTASNQVLLRVRFAEVSRSAITELGAALFTSPTGVSNVIGRATTGQFPSVGYDDLNVTKDSSKFGSSVTSASGKFTFSDFLNLFLFSEKFDIGAMVKALSTKGLFQSLAEPNLVAESGKEASFLAGGEFPVPIAQGGQSNAISVQYKEFGVRLNFTPVIHGDRVHLKVRPEVSTLDFANGVLLQGFRIPALSTRRTETEVDLLDGQTFAIAGLMNNTLNSTMQKIPGIGDIPIIGNLFKSKAANKDQTELVVMITPQILQRKSAGVTSTLPGTPETFLAPVPLKKLNEPLPPAFSPERAGLAGTGAMRPSKGMPGSDAPAPAPVPDAAPKADAPKVDSTPKADAAPKADSTQAAADAAKPLSAKDQKKLDEANRKKEKADQEAQTKAAHEQAKHDAEAAKVAAEQAKRQAKIDAEAARTSVERAKRQAEAEKSHQKAIDEASAKAKEADAKYQAEVARKQK